MEEEKDNKDAAPVESSETGCLPNLFFWIGVPGFFIALEKFKPGLGREVGGYVLLGIPILLIFAFLFSNGTKGFSAQFGKMVYWVIGLLVLGTLLTQCDGGAGNCAYRVGCW